MMDIESASPSAAGDDEGLLFAEANGRFASDDSTKVFRFTRGTPVTFGDSQAGKIDGIDGETHAAP